PSPGSAELTKGGHSSAEKRTTGNGAAASHAGHNTAPASHAITTPAFDRPITTPRIVARHYLAVGMIGFYRPIKKRHAQSCI
ncbi:MAG: hypothetical protein V4578_08945, partial [Pseudomonadota bacterium]